MSRTLFVFLFSDRVDSYINAVAHAYDKEQVDAVCFVYVRGTPTGLTDILANTVFSTIANRLEELSRGGAEIYQRIQARLLDRRLLPLDYSSLRSGLSRELNKCGGANKCMVDVTGAAKGPAIDVFSVCLALGVRSIYTFELKNKPDPANPEKSLYHFLGPNDYSYTRLTETEPVKSSRAVLLRKFPMLWYVVGIALAAMIITLIILVSAGPDNVVLQGINLLAAVVGLFSPLIALFQESRRT